MVLFFLVNLKQAPGDCFRQLLQFCFEHLCLVGSFCLGGGGLLCQDRAVCFSLAVIDRRQRVGCFLYTPEVERKEKKYRDLMALYRQG